PEKLQSSALEHDLAPRALNIAADPAHLRGVNPSPADDGEDRGHRQDVPSEIGPERTREGKPERLPVGSDVRNKVSQEEPVQHELSDAPQVANRPAAGQVRDHRKDDQDDNSGKIPERDGAWRSGKGEVWASRDLHAGHQPVSVPAENPRRRDNNDQAEKEQDAAPGELPDSEFDRHRSDAAIAATNGRFAVLWDRRRHAARHQSRHLAGLLPSGHTLGPDQRLRRDRAARDQVAKLCFGIGTLLLTVGCKKPGSTCHSFPPKRLRQDNSAAAQRALKDLILTDDPQPCTGPEGHSSDVSP